jgi:galactose mutarotase-like enzyme
VGWDECFPTVAPWDATATAWGRRLRDHGDLWGQPWTVDAQSSVLLTTSHTTSEYRFTRTLELLGSTLRARYEVTNLGGIELPWMWALHGLLAVTPADRLELPGITSATATYLSHRGETLAVPELPWPGPGPALPLALDVVHPASAQFAGKLYVGRLPGGIASVGGPGGWIDLGWNADEIGYAGLWFNYGGWPGPGTLHHIAVEPTTAPVDHLGAALAGGTALTLAPGARRAWTVTLTLRS